MRVGLRIFSESLYCSGSAVPADPPGSIPTCYIRASGVGGWANIWCGVECLDAGRVVVASVVGDVWSSACLSFRRTQALSKSTRWRHHIPVAADINVCELGSV